MKTSRDWLDQLKAAHRIPSDYALAKALHKSKQYVSAIQSGKTTLGDDTALKVAALLDADPCEVLASVQLERAKSEPVRAVWEDLLRRVGAVAFIAAVGIGGAAPGTAEAGAKSGGQSTVCIMSNRRRPRKNEWTRTLLALFDTQDSGPSLV